MNKGKAMKILIATAIAILLIATACSGGDDLSVTTNQVGFSAGPTTTTESDEADSSEVIEVFSEPAPVTTEPTVTTAAPVIAEPSQASDSTRDRLAEVMPKGNVVYLDGINPEDVPEYFYHPANFWYQNSFS